MKCMTLFYIWLYSQIKLRVRQGENLTVFLFSIYFYGLHDLSTSSNAQCLPTISRMFDTKLNVFLKNKLFAIWYQMTLYY